jgi:hypothetical protein
MSETVREIPRPLPTVIRVPPIRERDPRRPPPREQPSKKDPDTEEPSPDGVGLDVTV